MTDCKCQPVQLFETFSVVHDPESKQPLPFTRGVLASLEFPGGLRNFKLFAGSDHIATSSEGVVQFQLDSPQLTPAGKALLQNHLCKSQIPLTGLYLYDFELPLYLQLTDCGLYEIRDLKTKVLARFSNVMKSTAGMSVYHLVTE